MFKINYRIIEDFSKLEPDFDIDGYFQIIVNNSSYGYYDCKYLEEGVEGCEWINIWFKYLLNAYLELKRVGYVAVFLEETYPENWLEFKKSNDFDLLVSLFIYEKTMSNQYNSIATFKDSKYYYYEWKDEKITIKEFKEEIILKTQLYIDEIESIGLKLNHIDGLKKLLEEVKNTDY